MKKTYEEVLSYVIDSFEEMAYQKVSPETPFWDLGMDSLDRVELAMKFERHFNISIADEEIEVLNTPKDFALLICDKL